MLIDHIGIVVSDYECSKRFYIQALAPLDIALIVEIQGWAGFGQNQKADFWFGPDDNPNNRPPPPMHIAFSASNRERVDRFYQAAISAGAKDNGAPELREMYHPHYYGAFVIDPDGHNIEAVCHKSEV